MTLNLADIERRVKDASGKPQERWIGDVVTLITHVRELQEKLTEEISHRKEAEKAALGGQRLVDDLRDKLAKSYAEASRKYHGEWGRL